MTEVGSEEAGGASETEPAKRARGWLTLYALAFLLVLVAAGLVLLAARSLLEDTGLLLASSIVSGIAIVTAILSVVLPRRQRPAPGSDDSEPSEDPAPGSHDDDSGSSEDPDPEAPDPSSSG